MTEVLPMSMAELEEQVRRCLGRRVRDLYLTAHDDGIILQGRASSYYAKQLAQHAVMQRVPLPIVANKIEVDSTVESKSGSGSCLQPERPLVCVGL